MKMHTVTLTLSLLLGPPLATVVAAPGLASDDHRTGGTSHRGGISSIFIRSLQWM